MILLILQACAIWLKLQLQDAPNFNILGFIDVGAMLGLFGVTLG